MTTRYLKTKGIHLYKHNDELYCKAVDVINLIHHELFEHKYYEKLDIDHILDRIEARIMKNALVMPDAEPATDITEQIAEPECPGRYGVGKEENGNWIFYSGSKANYPQFTDRPCEAKLYVNYRDAFACADFIDGEWDVLDFYDNWTEEQRHVRDMTLPFPYDADDGNYQAIPIQIVT